MKNIGILTFQFANNYGAVLQAYALKKILERYSNEVEVINYCPYNLYKSYSLDIIWFIKKQEFGKIIEIPRRIKQKRLFDSFQKEELGLGTKKNDINNDELEKYDVIIVGSDQVWNDEIVDNIEAYFLKNVSQKIKISYAASFGKKHISAKVKNLAKTCLETFQLVSLRESNTIACMEKVGLIAYHTADPVLLLTKEEWREFYLSKNKKRVLEKYILYIDLMNDKKLKEEAVKLGQKFKLPILAIHPTCWKFKEKIFHQLYDVGPFEYLYLIDNASHVITNSFHGLAFSYIFQKKVTYYLNSELNNRTEDFLKTLQVDSKQKEIDFSNVKIDILKNYGNTEEVWKIIEKLIG